MCPGAGIGGARRQRTIGWQWYFPTLGMEVQKVYSEKVLFYGMASDSTDQVVIP